MLGITVLHDLPDDESRDLSEDEVAAIIAEGVSAARAQRHP
jgi:hypothetical protein